MAIKLTELATSLTKEGAYKVAWVLPNHGADEVLDAVVGVVAGVNIDEVQARSTLSAPRGSPVPEIWERVRALGPAAINALVMVGVVFSHHLLIAAMVKGREGRLRGRVRLDDVPRAKVFTNLKGMFKKFGFATKATPQQVDYDLSPLLNIEGLGPLVFDLLQRKLRTAGWGGGGDAINLMARHRFHTVFGLSKSEFRSWLEGNRDPATRLPEDVDFATGADVTPTRPFAFVAGHTPRKTGKVARRRTEAEDNAELLHNEVQTAFFKHLVRRFGAAAVGTEQPTGLGTSVDLVVELAGRRTFYEIKIAPSVRACLRQALPQLLEYAYWRCTNDLVHRLVIVGVLPLTDESRKYLAYLREQFGLPVWYKRFVLRRLGR